MNPAATRLARLRARAGILQSIRGWFDDHGFTEVETPVRIAAPALEDHIDAEPAGDLYLRTSPELHMKRLLAEGMERIYSLGPCFRRGEYGARHHAEYTMLEWYRAGSNADGMLDDAQQLIRRVATEHRGEEPLMWNGCSIDVHAAWEHVTVADVFRRAAGWDPLASYDPDRFDLDLVNLVEPSLRTDIPVVLKDYPPEAAALASIRREPGRPPVAERWELYIGGMELANAYTELTDAAEQRRRFAACAAGRAARGKPVYPVDEAFLDALGAMPPCGGIALGVDRLVMLMTGAVDIGDVVAFRE